MSRAGRRVSQLRPVSPEEPAPPGGPGLLSLLVALGIFATVLLTSIIRSCT